MAHSLSARKRVRQNAKRRVINRARKSMVKTQIKHFETALSEGNLVKSLSQQLKPLAGLFHVAFAQGRFKMLDLRLYPALARAIGSPALDVLLSSFL